MSLEVILDRPKLMSSVLHTIWCLILFNFAGTPEEPSFALVFVRSIYYNKSENDSSTLGGPLIVSAGHYSSTVTLVLQSRYSSWISSQPFNRPFKFVPSSKFNQSNDCICLDSYHHYHIIVQVHVTVMFSKVYCFAILLQMLLTKARFLMMWKWKFKCAAGFPFYTMN